VISCLIGRVWYTKRAEFRPWARKICVGASIVVAAVTEVAQALSAIPHCQITAVVALENGRLWTVQHASVTKTFASLLSLPFTLLAAQIFSCRLLHCSSTLHAASTEGCIAVCTHVHDHLLLGLCAHFFFRGFAAQPLTQSAVHAILTEPLLGDIYDLAA
jgi:hypothetical protein